MYLNGEKKWKRYFLREQRQSLLLDIYGIISFTSRLNANFIKGLALTFFRNTTLDVRKE